MERSRLLLVRQQMTKVLSRAAATYFPDSKETPCTQGQGVSLTGDASLLRQEFPLLAAKFSV
jgi:hypothetical protein